MMHLMDFLQAAGHRFQNIPVDLPVQWRQEDSDELVDTGTEAQYFMFGSLTDSVVG